MTLALLLLLLAASVVVGMLLFAALASKGISPGAEAMKPFVPYVILGNIPVALVACYWGLRRTRMPIRKAFWLHRASAATLVAAVLLGLGTFVLMSEARNLMHEYTPVPNWGGEVFGTFSGAPFLGALLLIVVAPVAEEPLFRSLLLGGMIRQGKPWRGVLLSSFLFGLIHVNPTQVVLGWPFGIVIGWLFLRTRSLWPCMVLHAVHNAGGFVVPFEDAGYNAAREAGAFQPWWLNTSGVALIALGALAVIMSTRRHTRPGMDNTGFEGA